MLQQADTEVGVANIRLICFSMNEKVVLEVFNELTLLFQ